MKVQKKLLSLILAITVIISIPLTVIADNQTDDYTSYFSYPQFRGDTLAQGLIDSKTPINSKDIIEKWAASFGTGWNSTPGTPIIVGDYLYVVVPGQSKLYRVSLQTGESLKSVDCLGSSQFFSTIAYNNGIIFVPRAKTVKVPKPTETDPNKTVNKSVSVIYAYDEATMDKLWETEPIGDVNGQAQPLSAVTFYNGYVYIGVSNGRADKGSFACFDSEDTDKNSSDETKSAVWTYVPEQKEEYKVKNGYYWSGGAIVNNAIVFGGEATELVIHSLTEDKVFDRIILEENPSAGIRSTVHFDKQTGRVYTTTKSGYVHSIKIKGDNTFDKSSLKSKKIGTDITSSPVVFKGRVYIGGGGICSIAGFSVLDAESLDIIYQISDIKTQSSPIVSTAYATAENNYQVYIYVVKYAGYENNDYSGYSPTSSCIFQVSDHQGQTNPEYCEMITPSKLQYCSQSVAIDGNGTMYYYNDAGRIYAMGHKNPDDAKFTAQDVINAIALIESNGKVVVRDEFIVKRLMARYNQLLPDEQAKVTNFNNLKAMLERVELLKNEDVIVKELNQQILSIVVDSITLDNDSVITELLSSYNALSDDSKAKVLHIETLNEAVAKIQGIKDQNMIASINKKIDELPSENSILYDDKAKIYDVVGLVGNQNDTVKAGLNSEKLNAIKIKVDAIETAINKLNDDIFKKLDPMNITLKDKATVTSLINDYNALSEKDRIHINNYDDVLFAQKAINELEKNRIVISQIFKNLVGSENNYVVDGITSDGKAYTVTFNGMNITNPELDFNANISFSSDNSEAIKNITSDALVFNFAQNNKLPGKATVQISVDLVDGQYSMYYYNETNGKAEFVQKVTVIDNKAQFDIINGSDYFISVKNDLSEEQSANSESENPKTGDTNWYFYIIILLFSAGTLISLKKKQGSK